MDKKRLEIIGTLILVVILIAVWGNRVALLRNRFASGGHGVTAAAVAPVPVSAAPFVSPSLDRQKNEKLQGPWVRDPFSGQSYTPNEGGVALELKGVIWDEKTPQALVNDSIVQIGDSIGPYKIVNITAQSIVIQDGLIQKEIKLEH
ncbi:MAG TPA: hypothetical protein PKL77_06365 [Candidatus Omnitrophota bacterium]|nr:hypothetical protein [Candidatus Omnitrophota bacterium]HPT07896.1 hypothetical protein [Candidatus Omnitrophota bacterium]